MLSHGNLLHKSLLLVQYLVQCSQPGDRFLSVLPAGTPTNAPVNISSSPKVVRKFIPISATSSGLAGKTPDYGWRSPAVGINL